MNLLSPKHKTVSQFLRDQLKRIPKHKDMFSFNTHHKHCKPFKWTNQELFRNSLAVAEGLDELGFQPSDRVLFWADNSAETLAIANGCLELGLSIVDAEVDSNHSLQALLQEQKPNILVLQPDLPLDPSEMPERFHDIIDQSKRSDVLQDLVPGMKQQANSRVPANEQGLELVVNTSFSRHRGTLPLRNLLNYFNPQYNTLKHQKVSDERLPAFLGAETLTHAEVQNTIVNYTSDSNLADSSIAFIKSKVTSGTAFCVAAAINTRFGTNIMIDCNRPLEEDIKALLEERVDTVIVDKAQWAGDSSLLQGRNLVLIDTDAQVLMDMSQIEKIEYKGANQSTIL